MIKKIYKTEFKDNIRLHNIIKINCTRDDGLENSLIYIVNKELREIAVGLGISENRVKILSEVISLDVNKYNELIENCREIDSIFLICKEPNIKGVRLIIENIMDYVGITCAIADKNVLFRGQASEKWDLTPSIFRKNQDTQKESLLYRDIKQWNNENFSSDSYIRDLCNMQHYGIPTRLIDWTSNPLHALYFATSDKTVEGDDANIFAIKVDDIYDIDSEEYQMIDKYFANRYIKNSDIEMNFIRKLNSRDRKYYFIKTKYYNQRIKTQQGYFSIYIDIANEEVNAIKNKISQDITNLMIKELNKEKIFTNDIDNISRPNEFKIIKGIIEKRIFRQNKIEELLAYFNKNFNTNDDRKMRRIIDESFDKGYLEMLDKICVENHNMNKILESQEVISINIPSKLKKVIVNQLDMMGINSRIIYPDEQGLAMYMREKYV